MELERKIGLGSNAESEENYYLTMTSESVCGPFPCILYIHGGNTDALSVTCLDECGTRNLPL